MNGRTISRIVAAGVCLTVLFGAASIASACPSCQAALADGEHGDLARGIYYSILFMMSMPFAIAGTFGFAAYRAIKREQRRVEQLRASERPEPPAPFSGR